MPRLLWLLAFVNLVIGSGAFVVGGILGPISQALEVSIPAAGQAMTAYALSTAVLAPLAMLATGRWPRRNALILMLALMTAGNAICALAGSLGTLLLGRVVMGVGAAFTPIAAGIAVALVEPARRGRALSLVFIGMSFAYVIGVPAGSWLAYRIGWHAPLWASTVLSAIALALVMAFVPRDVKAPGAAFAGLGRLLGRADVLSVLAITLLYFIAIFAVFSFSGPVLLALVPMSAEALSLTLAAFGCAGVAGTLVGGWANDRFGARRSLWILMCSLGLMMALLPLTRGSHALLLLVLVIWGTAGFGMMAPQQSRLAALDATQAPMLLSLNTSMLYLGTAFGASVGGAAAAHLGLAQLAWSGLPFVALALVILAFGPKLGSHGTMVPRSETAR